VGQEPRLSARACPAAFPVRSTPERLDCDSMPDTPPETPSVRGVASVTPACSCSQQRAEAAAMSGSPDRSTGVSRARVRARAMLDGQCRDGGDLAHVRCAKA
jgi:hypothetical protein